VTSPLRCTLDVLLLLTRDDQVLLALRPPHPATSM
jgi:hypothetical protein